MIDRYLSEPFTDKEIEQLLKQYCDFLVIEGMQSETRYNDFWSTVLSEPKYAPMISKLLLDDYPLREPDCFRWAFKKSLTPVQERLMERAERDPFFRFRARLLDEDKLRFDKVMEDVQLLYNDQLHLNILNPAMRDGYDQKKGLMGLVVDFIKTEMGGRFSNPLSLFSPTSIRSWQVENIPNDNSSNVFDDIADTHGVQVAAALVKIVKKKFINNLISSNTLKDVMDKTKGQVKAVVPEEMGDILFSKSWYRTMTVVLPNYMTEKERGIFKSRHFSGVTPVYELPASRISLRATASFARAMTVIETQRGADQYEAGRPANKISGRFKRKPPA